MVHVFDLRVSRQLVEAAFRVRGLTRKVSRRCSLKMIFQAHAESSLRMSFQRGDSVRNTNPPLLEAIEEMTLDSSMAPFTVYAPRCSGLFCLNGNGSGYWT